MKKLIVLLSFMLTGCIGAIHPALDQSYILRDKPKVEKQAQNKIFDKVPELDGPPIPIAVYSFTDKTGQRKPSQNSIFILYCGDTGRRGLCYEVTSRSRWR